VLAYRGTRRNDCEPNDPPYASDHQKGIVLYSRIGAPINATLILCGDVWRNPAGFGGDLKNRVDIPVELIGGGTGAIADFEVFIGRRQNGRNYVESRCADGLLEMRSTVDYHDGHSQEVDDIAVPCT
jgi:hypothetical protein